EHHHIVIANEPFLSCPYRVVRRSKIVGPVQVIVERWLVRNDEVLPFGGCPLKHIVSREHRCRYAGDRRGRIARLDCVHGFLPPLHAGVLLDARDYIRCRQGLLLRLRNCSAEYRANEFQNHVQFSKSLSWRKLSSLYFSQIRGSVFGGTTSTRDWSINLVRRATISGWLAAILIFSARSLLRSYSSIS